MIKEQKILIRVGLGWEWGEERIQGLQHPLKGCMLKVRPDTLETLINFPPPTSKE